MFEYRLGDLIKVKLSLEEKWDYFIIVRVYEHTSNVRLECLRTGVNFDAGMIGIPSRRVTSEFELTMLGIIK